MKKDKYFYPDVGDINSLIYIENNEPYKGYWEKSENEVLKYFTEICKKKSNKTFLDIGTGNGSLLTRFEPYFKNITAIDPDEKRLAMAKEIFKGKKNITFINQTLLNSKLKSNSFDVILCSHVIQLVRTPYLKDFVDKLYQVLKPGGKLVILTAHSRQNVDKYYKSFINYTDIKHEIITQEKFNLLRNNNENILPQHSFSIQNLRGLFSRFRILDTRVFHIMHKVNFVDRFCFRDDFYNLHPFKKKLGLDVYMLLKKPKKLKDKII